MNMDQTKAFDYENGFYLTAPVNRISKFVTHLDLFRRTQHLAGDIVECGVFKGVSLCRWIKFRSLFGNAFSKKIVAFDTFGLFPKADFPPDQERRNKFVEEAGEQSIGREQLMELLTSQQLYQNIELVEGDILKTVPAYLCGNQQLRISLLHIDVDLYEPTKTALELFYPHVVRGGIVILDDYGAFPGANKAIDDFFADKGTQILKLPYANAISFVEKP